MKAEDLLVCVDCGHGGKDSGAVGPGGTKESETVLVVGLELTRLLIAYGFRTMMTREDDTFLTLTQRARLANKAKAKIFVSIHNNSAENPAWGTETFIARGSKVSYPLAEALQDGMLSKFPGNTDRGVKRANFTVLTKTQMEAALVELNFIHTACGEDQLKLTKNRKAYARGLFEGILHRYGMKPMKSQPAPDPKEPKACKCVTLASAMKGHVAAMELTLSKYS